MYVVLHNNMSGERIIMYKIKDYFSSKSVAWVWRVQQTKLTAKFFLCFCAIRNDSKISQLKDTTFRRNFEGRLQVWTWSELLSDLCCAWFSLIWTRQGINLDWGTMQWHTVSVLSSGLSNKTWVGLKTVLVTSQLFKSQSARSRIMTSIFLLFLFVWNVLCSLCIIFLFWPALCTCNDLFWVKLPRPMENWLGGVSAPKGVKWRFYKSIQRWDMCNLRFLGTSYDFQMWYKDEMPLHEWLWCTSLLTCGHRNIDAQVFNVLWRFKVGWQPKTKPPAQYQT